MPRIKSTCATAFFLLLSTLIFFLAAHALPAFPPRSARPDSAPASSPADPNTPESLPSFSEPGISPDGSEIAFVSGGDIWTVPATGGEARLLISHPATESRPLYSPDGKRLALVSNRTGNGDVYVLTFATGAVDRLTYDDAPEQVSGWSHDGRFVYFSTSGHDLSWMNDIYRVSVSGGTPMPVSADVYENEFFGAPSPDGSTLAFSARGISFAQWWRNGHSHLDDTEIWLMHPGATPSYERFTEPGAKELWPMWSADGRSIFYMSDRAGAENIWVKPLSGAPRQITHFRDGRALWPSISADGRVIAFERNFAIWKLDTATGKSEEVPITLRGAVARPTMQHLSLTNQFRDLALSPDGKKVAFAAHGQIFAASAKEEGATIRVTHTSASESGAVWAPDSKRIVYISDRDGPRHLFLYDFTSNTETQLTHTAQHDVAPAFSPDGKHLAFQRGTHELRVLDLDSKQEHLLASAQFDPVLFTSDHSLMWSPDNQWIAFLQNGGKGFVDLFVVRASGGTPQCLTFLANTNADSVSWAPDGAAILFATSERTEPGQVARVDLVPRAPKFHEDQFRDLFKEEPKVADKNSAKPPDNANDKSSDKSDRSNDQSKDKADSSAKSSADESKKPPVKPVEINFDGIRRRLELIPAGLDVQAVSISPDGKTLLLTAQSAGQVNLYTYSIDELAKDPPVARQLTSTPGRKTSAQFSPDSKEVFYLEQGRIQSVAIDSRQTKPLAVTAEMDVDFEREKTEMFQQAWTALRDTFFDANFNGADWEALRVAYAPRIQGADTYDDVRRLLSLMIGELNSSHSGVGAPPSSRETVTGHLGVRFDPAVYERDGRLRISHITPLGPVALAKDIHVGDTLLAINGQLLSANSNVDALLEHTIGKRIVLTVASKPDASDQRQVPVRPIPGNAEEELLYREWVEQRRAYVEKISGGRLGYIHMPDMSAESLAHLYVDLDTENQTRDGVVIDVRNNNGGFVNVYAIDVLSRRPYLTMTVRGLPPTPARPQLGQRALERPTILVTNQHSLSDAEDFTEGYRSLHLGKVVGESTAGWIIYTSGIQLIDGSTLRIPFIKITDASGAPMEMHPRPVDIAVTRPVGESYTGRDIQLDAAVRELLREIDTQSKTQPEK